MITFEHVSKTYANGVKGLDQVDLTIGDGEFVAVIGLSGAGKSTFLRAINRLHDITEGDIRINGVSVTGAGKRQLRVIRRHIGMISQTFNLVKRSTVQKNVLSGRLGYYPTWKSILGIFSKEDYRLASEALEKVGITFDAVVSLEISDEEIVERMGGRRVCASCGAPFHVKNLPPKVEGVCDACGGKLEARADDKPEVVRDRLKVYHKETAPLKDFYAARNLLKTVENQPTVAETTTAILKALGL